MSATSWTEADFENLSWHDNPVHGVAIREGEYGLGTLVLDIDYIVEWRCGEDRTCSFLLAPADLSFEEVSDLVIGVDGRGISMGPLSIGEIRREATDQTQSFGRHRWIIVFNFPPGEISFMGAGFVQELRAAPIESSGQALSWAQRQQATRR